MSPDYQYRYSDYTRLHLFVIKCLRSNYVARLMTVLSQIIRLSEGLHALREDNAVTEGNATTPSVLALSGWSPTD